MRFDAGGPRAKKRFIGHKSISTLGRFVNAESNAMRYALKQVVITTRSIVEQSAYEYVYAQRVLHRVRSPQTGYFALQQHTADYHTIRDRKK